MRTKGYKCYNIKCGACVGKTLCGLSGDEALTCVDRMVNQKTNADRIRAMSDEELANWIIGVIPLYCDCCVYQKPCRQEEDDSVVNYAEKYDCMTGTLKWLQQPVKEDA